VLRAFSFADLLRFGPPSTVLQSAIKIKAFLSRVIGCRRVHVTRLAHG
jgi:hypothetical protein